MPTRPIHVVIPHSAGGAADVLTRIVTGPMSRDLGQPIVIENFVRDDVSRWQRAVQRVGKK